jgi:uncharacterized protein YjbI with pentapeptide repeats
VDVVEVNGYTIEPGANLRGADLRGADLKSALLTGACLVGADLEASDLYHARFDGADLSRARLAGVKCYGTSFARANLTEVVLTGAQLWGSDFTRTNLTKANLSGVAVWMSDFGAANLTEADLTEADLSFLWNESPDGSPVLLNGANLSRANLRDTKLRAAVLPRANLSGADLLGTDLHGADLSEADFTGADLAYSDFVGANLCGANLTGARLWFADFTRADLTGANLTGAEYACPTLTRANLTNANLAGADLGSAPLEGANLEGANLTSAKLGSNLSGVNLSGADLSGADLSGTDLSGTDLSGTDLEGANLEGANLEGAVVDDSTIWPGGFDPKTASAGVEKDVPADPVPVVQEVKSFAETAGIQRLCHFTRVELLPEIFRDRRILPTSELLLRNPACTRNDYDRRDNHLGFVSCSVQYPNLWVLDRFRDRYPDSEGWVILVLRPNRLWATGTLFSPVNAAQGSGRHVGEGLTGLEAMFQPNPPSKYPHPRGPDHLRCCPTDNQAEVLVPDGVPTADVVGILVENERRLFDITIETFSSPSPDGQRREQIPGSPWVEHNPELFDSGGLAACISKGVEIPVRRERWN